MPPGGDIAEISARLADRAASLAAELFPGGHREGHDYVCASRAQGGPGDSLKIVIAGPERGHYKHFGENHGGDLLDLVAHYHCNGSLAEARRWARRWLGLAPGEAPRHTRVPAEGPPGSAAAAAQSDADLRARRERARKVSQAIYLAAQPAIEGTPVEWYLRGRGIDLAALPAPPRALRYHPALDYPWAHVARRPAPPGLEAPPAMVAHVCGLDGRQLAVHRTYLEVVKPGTAVKLGQHTPGIAALAPAKLTKGSPTGGLVRLSNGTMTERATGWIKPGPILAEAPARQASGRWDSEAFDKIYLAEGIENALTFAAARPECRVAATVSLANMAHVALPDWIATVVLIRDNDAHAAARRAFDKAIWRFRGQGRAVKLIEAPEGKDLNDYWQKMRGAA